MKCIKIIVLCCMVFIIGCRKTPIVTDTTSPTEKDIFSVKELNIKNEDPINFNLNSAGVYTLTLFDSVNQQVVTRERIIGKNGNNSLKLYTKSLPVRYLYLSLEDDNSVQIGKTLLIIN
jgi:hypothetical protein